VPDLFSFFTNLLNVLIIAFVWSIISSLGNFDLLTRLIRSLPDLDKGFFQLSY